MRQHNRHGGHQNQSLSFVDKQHLQTPPQNHPARFLPGCLPEETPPLSAQVTARSGRLIKHHGAERSSKIQYMVQSSRADIP